MDYQQLLAVMSASLLALSAGGIALRIVASAQKDRERELVLLKSSGVDMSLGSELARDAVRDAAIAQEGDADEIEHAIEQVLADDARGFRLSDKSIELKFPVEARRRLDNRRLWVEAQKRLSTYHELAVIQGRQSFRMLLLFSALGFGLLGFVVWSATTVETTAGGIALGAAGAAGGALSAYIGRTFMRAYRDANARLKDYFAEPLDMSRLLAAERLLEHVDEQSRSIAAMHVIDAALSAHVRMTPIAAFEPAADEAGSHTVDVVKPDESKPFTDGS